MRIERSIRPSRLLSAVSAGEAEEVERMKMELLRVRFDEQMRTEKRRTAGTAIESQASATLKPWREVVTPHQDVAQRRYQQAEFAADLWQVHIGEGIGRVQESRRVLPPHVPHREPEAVARGRGAAAVWHRRRSGHPAPDELRRRQDALDARAVSPVLRHPAGRACWASTTCSRKAGVTTLPTLKRVVLVGNKISPGQSADEARWHGRSDALG